MLPACRKCNRSKADHDHGNLLLKPDSEDPEPYFWIHPDTGRLEPHPKLGDTKKLRALETIRLCDLQRPALGTKRAEMLSRVGRWVEQLGQSMKLTKATREEWDHLSRPTTEYKFVIRHALELRGQHRLSAEDRMRYQNPL